MGKYFSIKTISKTIVFLIAVIILSIVLFQTSNAIYDVSSIFDKYEMQKQKMFEDPSFADGLNSDSSEIFSSNKTSSFAVLEATTMRVLDGQNLHERMEMASTTKIMTAIVTLENCDLDKQFKIPKEAVGIEGSSIYLKENEIWTIRDLLYGLMLRSGNDSAVALAIAAGGSLEGFVDMMNAKADELGLKNTHFDNPHGLHSDTHYTSAYDLAVISAYAMQNEQFEKIVSSKFYVAEANDTRERQFFANKNKLLSSYQGANGIKTGYTTASGRCLVSAAKRNGMQVVCVVLNCYDMWNACASHMNKAFDEYVAVEIGKKGDGIADLSINDKKYTLALQNDLTIPFKDSDTLDCQGYIDIDKDIKTPVAENSVIGKINFYDGNRLLFGVNIVNIEEINDTGVLRKLQNLVGNWNASYVDGEVKQIFSFDGSGV